MKLLSSCHASKWQLICKKNRFPALFIAIIFITAAIILIFLTNRANKPQIDTSGTMHEGADMAMVLFIGDRSYSRLENTGKIITGDQIGVCGWQINDDGHSLNVPEDTYIYSTDIAAGCAVYEWVGFDSSFRLCAENTDGKLVGYQRYGVDFMRELAASETAVSSIFDLSGRVTGLLITAEDSVVRITDADTLSEFTDELMALTYNKKSYNDFHIRGKQLHITIILDDGQTLYMSVWPENGSALYLSHLVLTDKVLRIIKDAVNYNEKVLP